MCFSTKALTSCSDFRFINCLTPINEEFVSSFPPDCLLDFIARRSLDRTWATSLANANESSSVAVSLAAVSLDVGAFPPLHKSLSFVVASTLPTSFIVFSAIIEIGLSSISTMMGVFLQSDASSSRRSLRLHVDSSEVAMKLKSDGDETAPSESASKSSSAADLVVTTLFLLTVDLGR